VSPTDRFRWRVAALVAGGGLLASIAIGGWAVARAVAGGRPGAVMGWFAAAVAFGVLQRTLVGLSVERLRWARASGANQR
jgi:hypothetical protein